MREPDALAAFATGPMHCHIAVMLSSLDMQVLSQLGSVLQLQLSPQLQRAYDEMALAALDVAACALPPSNATQQYER